VASALEALHGVPDDLLHGGDLKPQRNELLGAYLLSHQPRLGVLREPGKATQHKAQAHTQSQRPLNFSLIFLVKKNMWFRVLGHFVVGVELGDFGREVAPVTDGLDAHVPPRRRWVLEHQDMRHGNVFHVHWPMKKSAYPSVQPARWEKLIIMSKEEQY